MNVFLFLSWCLMALAKKVHPMPRHDNRPWRDLDLARAARAGLEMTVRFVCIWTKTDWAELASSFGLPAHNDGLRSCFKCNCHDANMHDREGASAAGLPWRENPDGDYEAACVRCELHVALSQAEHAMIIPLLTDFDKRSTGSLGRSFKRDVLVNGAPLRKGDRLEVLLQPRNPY